MKKSQAGLRLPKSDRVDLARFDGAVAAVILPTLNEEKGLARTLSELPLDRFDEAGHRVVPVVIDGGSTDGTLAVARDWNIPVLVQSGRGKGGAMLEAIAWVHRQGIPYVVVLDADATYPPDRILPALDLLRGGTDLVIGVRHPVWGPPSDVKDLVHRVGNLVMSYASSFLARRTILDLCSGFWGVSTERFMELGLDDTTFAIEAELVLKAVRRGFSLHQIPVDYRERLGTAKLHAVRDGGQIMMAIFQHARPAAGSLPPGATPVPWSRDLLSIGLSLGISGAVVECAPTDTTEASDIAHYLRRNLPDTELRVGADLGARRTGFVRDPSTEYVSSASTLGVESPLVVSLPSGGSDAGDARSVTVSIRNQRRRLTIELPVTDPGRPEPNAGAWSRAGGWAGPSLPRREWFPSLLVVTSRINHQRERQQEALLSANGFRVTDHPNTKFALRPALGSDPVSGAPASGQ